MSEQTILFGGVDLLVNKDLTFTFSSYSVDSRQYRISENRLCIMAFYASVYYSSSGFPNQGVVLTTLCPHISVYSNGNEADPSNNKRYL